MEQTKDAFKQQMQTRFKDLCLELYHVITSQKEVNRIGWHDSILSPVKAGAAYHMACLAKDGVSFKAFISTSIEELDCTMDRIYTMQSEGWVGEAKCQGLVRQCESIKGVLSVAYKLVHKGAVCVKVAA